MPDCPALRALASSARGPCRDLRQAGRPPHLQSKPSALVQRAVELAEARQRMDQSRLTCAEATRHGPPRELNAEHDDGGPAGHGADVPFPVQSPVTHKKWGAGLVMRYEEDVITVLFEREGYKTLSRKAVLEGKLLKPA